MADISFVEVLACGALLAAAVDVFVALQRPGRPGLFRNPLGDADEHGMAGPAKRSAIFRTHWMRMPSAAEASGA
jgi:hypothetical protein